MDAFKMLIIVLSNVKIRKTKFNAGKIVILIIVNKDAKK